jgi:hypothetical protein
MHTIRNLIKGLAAIALIAGAAAVASADDAPVYIEGAQYTASVDVESGQWRLMPLDGHDLRIDTAPCGGAISVPTGVWLLQRDGAGQPELRAPSTTALPQGHPGIVALRGCGDVDAAYGPTLNAPQQLIDVLVASTGAVYVDG